MNTNNKYIDYLALWVLIFGLWPIADPGHGAVSVLAIVDVALHGCAAGLLSVRWKVTLQRRSISQKECAK